MANDLHQVPTTQLKGVGASLAEKLAKLNIYTAQDLLFHLPLRYQDRTRITAIGALQFGHEVVIQGTIQKTQIAFGKRKSLMCQVQDSSGIVTLRFFHFTASQKNNLTTGAEIRCFGEVRHGSSGYELYHPEYQLLNSDQPLPVEEHLTPIYPTTEGLSQKRIRGLCSLALDMLNNQHGLTELLPNDIQRRFKIASLIDAIMLLHQPPPETPHHLITEGKHPAQQRLKYEELLAHQLSLLRLRQKAQKIPGYPLATGQDLQQTLGNNLPFKLTGAQQRVINEINADLAKPAPMLRLVQGDVGSGKTMVAVMAALKAVANGYQAAVMAPTEILAEQHLNNFTTWLTPLGLKVSWLAGKLKGKKRAEQLTSIASGEAHIVVGTHAIFQDDVQFKQLALVIVDEQHRFGVHQRLSLMSKGENGQTKPHQLIMTATPIPRTLAMCAYADLDCSVIDELPPGRTPVTTVAIEDSRRPHVIQRVQYACQNGRQAYWVCTLIEESEALQCQAAEATAEQLREELPDLSIGLIHGRMKASEKAAIMAEFKANNLNLLVATTVIEVGVDVPNASLMIIENPERLGLAQLHQLRGRVGRGSTDSYCVLLYHRPLSKHGRARLEIMRETNDGFAIAEKDLELRGPGEVLGTRQTGLMQFKIASLEQDAHLLPLVKNTAEQLISTHPDTVEPLVTRWLGQNEQYANV
ncbi:ATP-dependent DNA helicase RecG [Spartinivicinus poritis]|uniref:ATP-dependent DNA helicase RecG n=1 Tax=Spartinivicinus poritis TaxID=2994640 RepID=A0ABT5UFQ7_9GAMM|nr:ATP-dependent DNA helicase RecG [Spartinivicinus sp. A2-2]MDE1465221.1 ATP-dependent DNA helicase RecG [Spartinivicinus sp. A2-2]